MLQEFRDIPLSLDIIYFILAGGTTGNNKAKPVGQEVYAGIRKALPFIDLFGASYKGHFLGGRLGVGFGVPVVKETLPGYQKVMWKLGVNTDPDAYPDVLSLNEAINSNVIMYARHALEGTRGLTDEDEVSTSGQMIYGTQAMPAGTILVSDIILRDPLASPLTEACYYAFIDTLLNDSYLGANFAKGCGIFEARAVINGEETTAEEIKSKAVPFWDNVQADKDKIGDILLRLDNILQNEPAKKAKKEETNQNNRP
jgi:hypothetical protein